MKPGEIEMLSTDPLISGGQERPKEVGVFATIMNLLNSILGAGVLLISNSFTFCGVIPSIFVMTVVAVLSYISAAMIVKMQHATEAESLPKLAAMTTGKIGSLVLGISSVIFCYSCMIAYIIMGGEVLISWLHLAHLNIDGYWSRALLILIFSALPVSLTIPKNLTFLGWISSAAIVSLVFYAVAMIIKGVQWLPSHGICESCETAVFDLGIFNALAIYSLSFALAVVIIPIVAPSSRVIRKRFFASGVAFFGSYVIVIVPGLIGYLMFGAKTEAMILSQFPDDDKLFIAVRAGYFVVLCCSYPVLGLSVQTAFSRWAFNVDDPAVLPCGRRTIVLLLENTLAVAVAALVPNVRPVMAVGGAIGGGLSNFVFPPLFWILLWKKPLKSWDNIICVIYIIFGLATVGISTFEAIKDAIHSFSTGQ